MTSSDREKLEADLTFARTAELFVDPVQGSFDAAHLKEVNRRIFQDLPAAGFDDVTPGVFRHAVDGQDWLKARGVTPKGQVFVAYSRMDIAAISRLDAALRTPLLAVLRDAKPVEAAKAFAGLYAELDYIHPFRDGNSRTLRAFTSQLAKSAGWHLDWARLGKTEQDRVQLYWARDKAVNALALPHVQSEATMKRLIRAQHAIPDSPKLHDLIGSVLRPTRALMFETRPESVALREHPELIYAYNTVRAAGTFFNSKFPSNPLDVDAGVRAVVAHVQNRLNAGEVKDFGRGRYTHLVDVPQESTALKAADRGTER